MQYGYLDAEFISPQKGTLSVLYWVTLSKKCKVYPLSYYGLLSSSKGPRKFLQGSFKGARRFL